MRELQLGLEIVLQGNHQPPKPKPPRAGPEQREERLGQLACLLEAGVPLPAVYFHAHRTWGIGQRMTQRDLRLLRSRPASAQQETLRLGLRTLLRRSLLGSKDL
jgi:hypothetical protein